MHEIADAIRDFWGGLGDGRGYVVGATVTFLGVALNIVALRMLEGFRVKANLKSAEAAWARERGARLEEIRRDAYSDVVSACESRAFLDGYPEEDQTRIIERWRGARARVRFVTDERALIEAADRLVDAAPNRDKDRKEFKSARTEFVKLCRVELGRADLELRSNPAT